MSNEIVRVRPQYVDCWGTNLTVFILEVHPVTLTNITPTPVTLC